MSCARIRPWVQKPRQCCTCCQTTETGQDFQTFKKDTGIQSCVPNYVHRSGLVSLRIAAPVFHYLYLRGCWNGFL